MFVKYRLPFKNQKLTLSTYKIRGVQLENEMIITKYYLLTKLTTKLKCFKILIVVISFCNWISSVFILCINNRKNRINQENCFHKY